MQDYVILDQKKSYLVNFEYHFLWFFHLIFFTHNFCFASKKMNIFQIWPRYQNNVDPNTFKNIPEPGQVFWYDKSYNIKISPILWRSLNSHFFSLEFDYGLLNRLPHG